MTAGIAKVAAIKNIQALTPAIAIIFLNARKLY